MDKALVRQWLAAVLWMLAAAAAVAQDAPASGIFTCVDANGRKLTSDRPIPECLDREQRLLNPSGTIAKKVGPSLTASERAKVEARERQENEERLRQLEDRRRERALLVRYPNRSVHDKERLDALEQVDAAANAARVRLTELVAQRKKLDAEMEFYIKDPSKAPLYLRRQVEENSHSQDVQKRFIADQDGEINRINARFDGELARLRPLWAANAGN